MNNLTMEMITKQKEVKVLIYNINEIGIDCTLYEQSLEKLKKDFTNELRKIERNDKIDISSKNKLVNKVYTKYLDKLSKLKIIISENIIYYDIKKKLLYINSLLKYNFSINDLNDSIDNLISFIDSIKRHNTSDFKEKKDIIDELYKTIYKVIKLEIKSFGTSRLLNYCKDNNIGTSYLNELALQNIKSIKGYEYIFDINGYIDDLTSSDVYLNEELIRSLISYETNNDYNNRKKDIDFLEKDKESKVKKLKKQIRKEENKRFNNKLLGIKKIARYSFSILFSLGIFTGLLKGTSNVKDKYYKVNRTTYIESDDLYEESSSYEKNIDHKDEVLIRIETPYENKGFTNTRKVEYAYVEKEALNNLNDYLELALNEEIDFKTTREYKKFLDAKDYYTENIIKVTNYDVDYNDYTMENAVIRQTLCYALLALLVLVHELYGAYISFKNKEKDNYKEVSLGTISYFYYLIMYIKKLQKDLKLSDKELGLLSIELGFEEKELENILNAGNNLRINHDREMSDLFNNDDAINIVNKQRVRR